jgi:hypothetical protein
MSAEKGARVSAAHAEHARLGWSCGACAAACAANAGESPSTLAHNRDIRHKLCSFKENYKIKKHWEILPTLIPSTPRPRAALYCIVP